MSNINNKKSFDLNTWEWDIYNSCFIYKDTRCKMADIDGVIERHGKFLIIETKSIDKEINIGQKLTHIGWLKYHNKPIRGIIPNYTICYIWGKVNEPELIQINTKVEHIDQGKKRKCDTDKVKAYFTKWFKDVSIEYEQELRIENDKKLLEYERLRNISTNL